MARNGKPDPNDSVSPIDVEHELPSAEQDDGGPAAETQPDEQVSAEEYRKLKAERDTLFDRLARLQAEFDNYRKRSAREQADFKEYAVADAVKGLLPIIDSLERALATAPADDKMRQGVELILRQFNDALTRMGVRRVESEGQRFDPTQHEAIEMVDSSDVPDHHVLDELQRGYKMKDRLLRPAMVRVARNNEKK